MRFRRLSIPTLANNPFIAHLYRESVILYIVILAPYSKNCTLIESFFELFQMAPSVQLQASAIGETPHHCYIGPHTVAQLSGSAENPATPPPPPASNPRA